MLIVTNFLVIALALFLALLVAASAANVRSLRGRDLTANSEFHSTVAPETQDDEPVTQPPAQLPKSRGRVIVLGQPLRTEQPPQLVQEGMRRRA